MARVSSQIEMKCLLNTITVNLVIKLFLTKEQLTDLQSEKQTMEAVTSFFRHCSYSAGVQSEFLSKVCIKHFSNSAIH